MGFRIPCLNPESTLCLKSIPSLKQQQYRTFYHNGMGHTLWVGLPPWEVLAKLILGTSTYRHMNIIGKATESDHLIG